MFLCVRVCMFPQDGDYLQFLKESNAEAVEEEERRYRFLAEKHCGLMQSVAILMTKVNYLKMRLVHCVGYSNTRVVSNH